MSHAGMQRPTGSDEARTTPPGPTARESKRFNFLVVSGAGTRILRATFPRWIAYGGLTLLALAVSALGAISGDYRSLKQQITHVTGLQRQVADQQALIDTFHRQIADISSEVSSWHTLHQRIWEPLGAATGPIAKGPNMGEGAAASGPAVPDDRAAVAGDLDRLSAMVTEEGRSLRALERFMAKAGRALVALVSRWPGRRAQQVDVGRRPFLPAGGGEFHGRIDLSADHGKPATAAAPEGG